jgi:uncharacterized Zn finger protein/DNA-binding transcriptional regulator YiaG
MPWGYFPRYVPVAARRAKAMRQLDELRKQRKAVEPVSIDGRAIAKSFWGKGWCTHLESFSDYSNRLPRGRTYVRNGSVCHLEIRPGRIAALVSGSRVYTVDISIRTLKTAAWQDIRGRCSGQIGSLLELLQGKLSHEVMTVVTDRTAGLFPRPGEIKFDCSCPDWATMCKHVAAVLYGVGNRLDRQPNLLFTLRGVDPEELIAEGLVLPAAADSTTPTLPDDRLGALFGIDLDTPAPQAAPPGRRRAPQGRGRKTAGSTRWAQHEPTSKVGTKPISRKTTDTATHTPRIRPTGNSLARLRRRLGDTVAEFARRLGVSAASVYRWESTAGRLQLKPHTLQALADLSRRTARKSKSGSKAS